MNAQLLKHLQFFESKTTNSHFELVLKERKDSPYKWGMYKVQIIKIESFTIFDSIHYFCFHFALIALSVIEVSRFLHRKNK